MPPRTRPDIYQIDASGIPDGQVVAASGGEGSWQDNTRVVTLNGASGELDLVGSGGTDITRDGTSITIDVPNELPDPPEGAEKYLATSFAGATDWNTLEELGLLASGSTDERYVQRIGDTMEGDLTQPTLPTASGHVTNREYVDQAIDTASAQLIPLAASGQFQQEGSYASADHDHDDRYLQVSGSGSFAASGHQHSLDDLLQSGADDGEVPVWTASGWVASGQAAGGGAPELHTHPLSDLEQSSAQVGDVPRWNGSAYVASGVVEAGSGYALVDHIHDDRYLPEASGDARYLWMSASADFLGSGAADDFQPIGNYASADHDHDGRYLFTEASATFASAIHDHDDLYQPIGSYASADHAHDDLYQPIGSYASADHNHDDTYQPIGSYASADHDHDDEYLSIEASAAFESDLNDHIHNPVGAHPASAISFDGSGMSYLTYDNVRHNLEVTDATLTYLDILTQGHISQGSEVHGGLLPLTASANFSASGHLHDDRYIQISASGDFSLSDHDHDGVYQPVGSYASADHNHDGEYLSASGDLTIGSIESLPEASGISIIVWSPVASAWIASEEDEFYMLATASAGFSASGHLHDERYLQIAASADFALSGHNHDDVYQPIGGYASADHDHDDQYQPIGSYASADHNHDGRYLLTEASATFASTSHIHDDRYLPEASGDIRYMMATASADFALVDHDHDGVYSLVGHNHDGTYLLTDASATFASAIHNHDGRYLLTEASATFASAVHNHDSLYQPIGSYASADHDHDDRILDRIAAYRPPTDFTWVTSGVTVTSQKELTKPSGTGWSAGAYSPVGFVHGSYVTFRGSGKFMIGLNSDPSTDHSYLSLDYAWYFNLNVCAIYENGSNVGAHGSVDESTVLAITHDGTNVRYWKDGAVVRTVARGITDPLYVDSSFHDAGSIAKDIQFGPYPGKDNENARIGTWVGGSLTAAFAHKDLFQTNASYALKQTSGGETTLNSAGGSALRFRIGNTEHARIDTNGRLHVVGTGINSGVMIGTDVHLYRSGANELTIPDNVVINGTLNVSGTGLFSGDLTLATGVLASYGALIGHVSSSVQIYRWTYADAFTDNLNTAFMQFGSGTLNQGIITGQNGATLSRFGVATNGMVIGPAYASMPAPITLFNLRGTGLSRGMAFGVGDSGPTSLYHSASGIIKTNGKIQQSAAPVAGDDLVNLTHLNSVVSPLVGRPRWRGLRVGTGLNTVTSWASISWDAISYWPGFSVTFPMSVIDIPSTGFYEIKASMMVRSTNASEHALRIMVNTVASGSFEIARSTVSNGARSSFPSVQVCWEGRLEGGESIEIQRQSGTSGLTIDFDGATWSTIRRFE